MFVSKSATAWRSVCLYMWSFRLFQFLLLISVLVFFYGLEFHGDANTVQYSMCIFLTIHGHLEHSVFLDPPPPPKKKKDEKEILHGNFGLDSCYYGYN